MAPACPLYALPMAVSLVFFGCAVERQNTAWDRSTALMFRNRWDDPHLRRGDAKAYMLACWARIGQECASHVYGEHLQTLAGMVGSTRTATDFRDLVWRHWQELPPDAFAEAVLDDQLNHSPPPSPAQAGFPDGGGRPSPPTPGAP